MLTLLICVVHGYVLGAVKAEKEPCQALRNFQFGDGEFLVPQILLPTGALKLYVCVHKVSIQC